MFEKYPSYFPTLREIRDELIKGQMKILEDNSQHWSQKTKFTLLKKSYKSKWETLFKIGDLGNIDESLNKKILSDPQHKITKHLLYIYSMETFVY